MCNHDYKHVNSILVQRWADAADEYIFIQECSKCNNVRYKKSYVDAKFVLSWLFIVVVTIGVFASILS